MSDDTVIVPVDLRERSYAIHIGSGILGAIGSLVAARVSSRRATVISDSNVGPLYGNAVLESLRAVGIDAELLTVPAGEASKCLAVATKIYDFLAVRRHERDEPIVALGGGMIGDLAGFVAATWMRGVPVVQCPTSLEAAIDAGIGGKTAVNLASGKNLIGAFHQPLLVCIDAICLETLERRDYVAALAESVKHAIISGEEFLRWHEENADAILAMDKATVVELVRSNCEVKARIVVADERERDTVGVGRAALNLGHTVGHAIESQLGYAIRHGEAVSLGMVVALDLAVRFQGLLEADRGRCERILSHFGLPTRSSAPLDMGDLIRRVQSDKKVVGGGVRFVLPAGVSRVEWNKSIGEEDLRSSIERLG